MGHRKFNQKKGAESLCTGFSAFLPAKGKELRGGKDLVLAEVARVELKCPNPEC